MGVEHQLQGQKIPHMRCVLQVYCLELLASAAQCLIFASFVRICEGLKVPEPGICIQMVNRGLQNLTFAERRSGLKSVQFNLFPVRIDGSDNVQGDRQSAASIF